MPCLSSSSAPHGRLELRVGQQLADAGGRRDHQVVYDVHDGLRQGRGKERVGFMERAGKGQDAGEGVQCLIVPWGLRHGPALAALQAGAGGGRPPGRPAGRTAAARRPRRCTCLRVGREGDRWEREGSRHGTAASISLRPTTDGEPSPCPLPKHTHTSSPRRHPRRAPMWMSRKAQPAYLSSFSMEASSMANSPPCTCAWGGRWRALDGMKAGGKVEGGMGGMRGPA